MLFKSKPTALDVKSVNIWEVGNGLWELATIDPDGVASGPMRPDPLADVMSYISEVLHMPVIVHSLDNIHDERLEAIKHVAGTVLEFEASPTGQTTEGGLLEFQFRGSEKVIRIGTPAQNTSVGLHLATQVMSLVGKNVELDYEIIYCSHGEESIRQLCSITGSTGDATTQPNRGWIEREGEVVFLDGSNSHTAQE